MGETGPGAPRVIGRYVIHGELASGGMATVHFGQLAGPVGFRRVVVLKRPHEAFANDTEFRGMLIDEARIAARVRHPNVVPTIDVVAADGELFLVMEYVNGESLARLVRAAKEDGAFVPLPVVSAIVSGVLHGLHAAHEATDEHGNPLHIVHRDVSPANILVGADGVPRLIDFGIAKAVGRSQATRDGELKGKLAYVSPEQLRRQRVDRRTDIHAAGVVLWELLTQRRLFLEDSEAATIARVLEGNDERPSALRDDVPGAVDAIVMRALARDPARRFPTARQMALELEAAIPVAPPSEVGAWVAELARDALAARAETVAAIEASGFEGSSAEASPAPVAPRRRWRARTVAASVVLAGVMVGGIAVMATRSASAVREDASPETDRRSVATTAVTAVTAVTAAPEAAPEAAPQESPPAVVAPPVSPAPSEHPATATSPRRKSSAKPTITATQKPCPVKSWLDADGVKHFSRGC